MTTEVNLTLWTQKTLCKKHSGHRPCPPSGDTEETQGTVNPRNDSVSALQEEETLVLSIWTTSKLGCLGRDGGKHTNCCYRAALWVLRDSTWASHFSLSSQAASLGVSWAWGNVRLPEGSSFSSLLLLFTGVHFCLCQGHNTWGAPCKDSQQWPHGLQSSESSRVTMRPSSAHHMPLCPR